MIQRVNALCLMAMLQCNQIIFGSDEEPRMNTYEFQYLHHVLGKRCKNIKKKYLSNNSLTYDLYMLSPIEKIYTDFRAGKPWKDIARRYKKYNIDINTPLLPFNEPVLIVALKERPLDYAYQILQEKNINASIYDNIEWNTALHLVAGHIHCHMEEQERDQGGLRIRIALKLINQECPINKLNRSSKTALAKIYTYGNFNPKLSTLFIEAGAWLMVNKHDKKWNILGELVKDLKQYNSNHSDRDDLSSKLSAIVRNIKCSDESTFSFHLRVIIDSFCKTFKVDYDDQFKKSYLTTALIFKRLKKDKKIFMSKMLVNNIALYCINPTGHIEATIEDACDRLHLSEYLDKPVLEDVESVINMIKTLVTPYMWVRNWLKYRSGDRSKDNLIVGALGYVKDEKHRWNK